MAEFDAVYPLGKGSKISNAELLYSLRSLIKHARNLGNIYVIGEKPSFLRWGDRLVHVPFVEVHGRYANVWEKVLAAANDERISEKFLWMNDDFYVLQDFDAGMVPFFSRARGLEKSPWAATAIPYIKTKYQQTLRRTYDALRRRGLPTHHFGTHQPINFEKSKIRELFQVFREEVFATRGLSLRICYGNYFNVERTVKTTRLIKGAMPKVSDRFAFSSHDSTTAELLRTELSKLYPSPSPFEKGT